MKYIQKILLMTAVAVLGLSSCTREELTDGGGSSNAPSITITTDESAITRAGTEPGTVAESSYNALHLYYYKNGTDEAPIHYEQIAAADGRICPQRLSVPEVVLDAGTVDVYAVASPAATTAMPGATAKRAELEVLITHGMVNGTRVVYADGTTSCIPMAGIVTGHNFNGATPNVTVMMTRAVAKLRIRVLNCIGSAAGVGADGEYTSNGYQLLPGKMNIEIENILKRGLLFPQTVATPEALTNDIFTSQKFAGADPVEPGDAFVPQTVTVGATTTTWLHTAYVNEHRFDAAPAKQAKLVANLPFVRPDGTEVLYNAYTLPLDFQLERNHIYNLTIKVYGPGEMEAVLEVDDLPWNYESHDITVGGKFEISNEECVVYGLTGSEFMVAVGVNFIGTGQVSISANNGITTSPTFLDQSLDTKYVKIRMPDDQPSGELTLTQGMTVKKVKIQRKSEDEEPISIYSLPSDYEIPSGISIVGVGSDSYAKLVEKEGRKILRTTLIATTATNATNAKKLSPLIFEKDGVKTIHNIITPSFLIEFGFGGKRKVSNEAEEWKVSLKGGKVKSTTSFKVRYIADEVVHTYPQNGEPTITLPAGSDISGSVVYRKKRHEFLKVNVFGRMEAELDLNGEKKWISLGGGEMIRHCTWIGDYMFCSYINYLGENSGLDTYLDSFSPFGRDHKFMCPNEVSSLPTGQHWQFLKYDASTSSPMYYVWESTGANPVNKIFYSNFSDDAAYIQVGERNPSNNLQYKSYPSRNKANGLTYGANWEWLELDDGNNGFTVAYKVMTRPTDDNPWK